MFDFSQPSAKKEKRRGFPYNILGLYKKFIKFEPLIYESDYADFLNCFDNKSVDLLLTDPPYMTDIENLNEFVNNWLPLALSKMKNTGRAYIFIGSYPRELYTYLNFLINKQDRFEYDVLVWTYRNTIGPSPKKIYKRNWQAILCLWTENSCDLQTDSLIEKFSVQDISAPDGRFGERYHVWQKPNKLANKLIRHSTKENDLVIDPFAGTGTFLIVAGLLGRKAFGCDNNEEIIEIAKKRGCIVKNEKLRKEEIYV